jgi:hypothetical protein
LNPHGAGAIFSRRLCERFVAPLRRDTGLLKARANSFVHALHAVTTAVILVLVVADAAGNDRCFRTSSPDSRIRAPRTRRELRKRIRRHHSMHRTFGGELKAAHRTSAWFCIDAHVATCTAGAGEPAPADADAARLAES